MASSLAGTLDSFRTLVSNCATWNAYFSSNATTAKAAIYRFVAKPSPSLPFAVCHMETISGVMVASPYTFSRNGTIQFRFEFARPSGGGISTLEDEFASISETCGDIMDEALVLSASGSTYMEIRNWTWDGFSLGNYVESTRSWRFTGTVSFDQG